MGPVPVMPHEAPSTRRAVSRRTGSSTLTRRRSPCTSYTTGSTSRAGTARGDEPLTV